MKQYLCLYYVKFQTKLKIFTYASAERDFNFISIIWAIDYRVKHWIYKWDWLIANTCMILTTRLSSHCSWLYGSVPPSSSGSSVASKYLNKRDFGMVIGCEQNRMNNWMITWFKSSYLAFLVALGTVLDALLIPERIWSYHYHRCCGSVDQRFDMPNGGTCQSELTSLGIDDDHTSYWRSFISSVFNAIQIDG